ncbi:hypothetical protein BU16DRAFT_233533 [Lophium mytilinum]|uniref:Secreted protein n=1 Tax=Lophium mytilinum TaxID=390894 RepID=A0A6A6R6G0_9PEZI|nr:hypothetical protein BU16DRAFT_233533 [Lophium mytilinum]
MASKNWMFVWTVTFTWIHICFRLCIVSTSHSGTKNPPLAKRPAIAIPSAANATSHLYHIATYRAVPKCLKECPNHQNLTSQALPSTPRTSPTHSPTYLFKRRSSELAQLLHL